MIPPSAQLYVPGGTPDPLAALLTAVAIERAARGWHDDADTLMMAVYRDDAGALHGLPVPLSDGMRANPVQELALVVPRIARDPALRYRYAGVFTRSFYGWLLMVEMWGRDVPRPGSGLTVVMTSAADSADRIELRHGHLLTTDDQELWVEQTDRDDQPRVVNPATMPDCTHALGPLVENLRRFTKLGPRIAARYHPDPATA